MVQALLLWNGNIKTGIQNRVSNDRQQPQNGDVEYVLLDTLAVAPDMKHDKTRFACLSQVVVLFEVQT